MRAKQQAIELGGELEDADTTDEEIEEPELEKSEPGDDELAAESEVIVLPGVEEADGARIQN